MNITDVYEAGADASGETLIVTLQDDAGQRHKLTMHHPFLSRVLGGFLFAGQIAARNRPSTTPLGAPMPTLTNLMEVHQAEAIPLRGNTLAVRLVVDEAPLEFQLHPTAIAAIRAGLVGLDAPAP